MPTSPAATLQAGLDHIAAAPRDVGIVEMIVRRPAVDEREVLDEARLDPAEGLVGDNWMLRGSSSTTDGSAHPDKQITIINSRCMEVVAGERGRWPLAGDQLYVDFDLSIEALPAGTLLRVGDALVRVSEQPHRGCGKFSRRFGVEALRFVNSEDGRRLRLRGLNAGVVEPGVVRVGDELARA